MAGLANDLKDRAAIVGLGATEFSKASGRSELRLAVEAIMDNNPAIEVNRYLGGGDLRLFARTHYGGGAACGPLLHAAMAVATGVAQVVVCYRAMNERSEQRFGIGVQDRPPAPRPEEVHFGWHSPYGLVTPASWKAWFYEQPITLEDHQSSRWIVEPLRLLDCCQESDGAVALVVTSMERARDLRQTPVRIAAAAQGATTDQQMMTRYYSEDITGLPEMGFVARQLYETAGIGPEDVQTAILYDHFTPFVLTQIEEFGFCGRGEAKDFIRDGNIELGGGLPINTNGGQLGEAYIHGMNGIAEGVRQVRGSSVNQVEVVEHVVVTAGTGVPTSGLILGSL